VLILSVTVFWGLIIIIIQLIVINKDKIIASGIIKDQFAMGNLQADVHWTGYEFLIGVGFVAAITLLFSTRRIKQKQQIFGTLIFTLLFTYCTLLFIAPRIEGYSQRAAIEFYKDKSHEDCYVRTLGFKSYAHLFYFNLKKPANPKAWDDEWYMNGDIDKPVYFVMKNSSSKEYLDKYPQLKVQYEENGFVFAKRDINNAQ
ncbi:MAG TPA: hypothetical protein VHO72_11730, partial [Bacteroidales bacterium]|nr:hypothetical protein [Bacteroidales bacterium]